MKLASGVMSLGLGLIVAWITLLFVPAPKTSGYAQMPPVLSLAPIEESENKALLAVGLLSKKSVMDPPEKELKPAAPPPDVVENKPLPPVPTAPAPPAPPPANAPQPTAPASTDMSVVPPSAPSKPPQMPSPMPPSPTGPQPSTTGSSTYASM